MQIDFAYMHIHYALTQMNSTYMHVQYDQMQIHFTYTLTHYALTQMNSTYMPIQYNLMQIDPFELSKRPDRICEPGGSE
jgi:hypothetical protein